MVLCGIGGCTIAEAKENLSQSEVAKWAAYLRRYGSLHHGRRIEISTAHLMTQLLAVHGVKNLNARDFMPHEPAPPKLSTDDAMRLMAKRD